MHESIAKRLVKQVNGIDLSYNPRCDEPNCDHHDCIKDDESGEWYKRKKISYRLEGDEVIGSLLAEQVTLLRSIRAMLLFFTVIAVIALVFFVLSGLGLFTFFM